MQLLLLKQEGGLTGVESTVYVVKNTDGLVAAPDEAAGEEGEEEDDAVVELQFRARHVEFVAEPVDVEERRGELV